MFMRAANLRALIVLWSTRPRAGSAAAAKADVRSRAVRNLAAVALPRGGVWTSMRERRSRSQSLRGL
jgi:hypothetical protein